MAQDEMMDTRRKKEIVLSGSAFLLDTLPVLPSSVSVVMDRDTVRSEFYRISGDSIFFDSGFLHNYTGNKLHLRYRVLGEPIGRTYTLLDSVNLIKAEDRAIYIGYDYNIRQKNRDGDLFFSEGLKYSGSFTRGFSFGNSQSLVLNSQFNMQLSGDLGNDLQIQAAISDENLPIQPQGTTQLLQEFDQVYIKVNKNNTAITAGDYILERPVSYFMNYYKKLKGLKIAQVWDHENHQIAGSTNFAVSRGKFARNQLEVQEGNQGPYKLTGNNGERILIILSGTERVYLDGRLLTRGIEYDYVIFYDQAEISFTPNILITKDKRVIVEFEYADQNYLRTQIAGHTQLASGKYQLNFHFYNEQDSKNTTGDIDLDSTDISILMEAGDNLSEAFRSGIRPVGPDLVSSQPTYRKQFEPTTGDSILVYSNDPQQTLYTASFSEVGAGKGSYLIDPSIPANGRAYKWVGPGNGAYEPVIALIPAERKQMISLNGHYNLTNTFTMGGELALSQFDLNRFSSLGNADNTGMAWLFNAQQKTGFGSSENPITLTLDAHIDFVHRDFNSLNPFRDPEYTRDWNLDPLTEANEWKGDLSAMLVKSDLGLVSYGYKRFTQQDIYQGNKHLWQVNFEKKGFRVLSQNSYLTNSGNGENSQFFRPNLRLEKSFLKLANWKIGWFYEMEKNHRRQVETEELLGSSFQFQYWKAYIESPADRALSLRIGTNRRTDWLPDQDQLIRATTADEWEFAGKWNQSAASILNWSLIYRDLTVENEEIAGTPARSSFLGNLDYSFQALNGAIRSSTSYQIGTGQEAKKEFEYVEVRNGEGQFIWLDDGDGIQQTGEFKLAPLQDTANFVRINIFNNEFIKIQTKSVNQSLRLSFRDLITAPRPEQSFLQKTLTKLSVISNLRINQKLEDTGDIGSISPFRFMFTDTSLVSYFGSTNHTIFFNRGDPTYDIQAGIRKNKNRSVQITGYEQLISSETFARIRWNYHRGLDLLLNGSRGSRDSDSEFFNQNDYQINFFTISPEINYRPTGKLRFILKYEFQDKDNQLPSRESASSHEFRLETTWRSLNTSSLNTGISYIRVHSDAPPNSSVELALLDGLKDGSNFLFNLDFTRRLSSFIDMIIRYEARKTGNSSLIHTARAQIKASF